MLGNIIGHFSDLLKFFLQLAPIQTQAVLSMHCNSLVDDVLEFLRFPFHRRTHRFFIEADVLVGAKLFSGDERLDTWLQGSFASRTVMTTGVLDARDGVIVLRFGGCDARVQTVTRH